MSLEFIFRLAGMVILAFAGLRLGLRLAPAAGGQTEVWALALGSTGALFGLILTPHLTIRPVNKLRDYLLTVPAQQLFAGVLGLIVGLIIAALISLPLSLLPPPYNALMPIVAALTFGYFGLIIFATRRQELFEGVSGRLSGLLGSGQPGEESGRRVLLDTSVIIDGRIADISKTGFIMGAMIVPRFVLNELQYIADASDPLRRQRGRRGIEMLNRLQKESTVPVQISDMDVEGVDAVDEKLILLARQLGCAILTNDFNLNRIADLQGVIVLNVNELANAIKTIYLPGESVEIQIIQEGREINQGVGYLEDGTMVVVQDGRRYLNKTISTTVTKVLQTSAGRMIFAEPAKG